MGKKRKDFSKSGEDDEDDDLDEEFDTLAENETGDNGSGDKDSADGGNEGDAGYDFEEEVINKIKKEGEFQYCPFCKKRMKSVLRHLNTCKRAPAEAKVAYKVYKKKKK